MPEACDANLQGRICELLDQHDIGYNRRKLFADPEAALSVLAEAKLAIFHLIEENDGTPRGLEYEALKQETDVLGARIMQMANTGEGSERLNELMELIQGMDTCDPDVFEDLCMQLTLFFYSEFHSMRCDIDSIANDLSQSRKGDSGAFQPIATPNIPMAKKALRENPNATSPVLAKNIGGTNMQTGNVIASGRGITVNTNEDKPIDKKSCKTWDEFWSMFFTEEELQRLTDDDAKNLTIAIGLAVPIKIFIDPETGKTDGHVVHMSDKFDVDSAMAPKNAMEEYQHSSSPKVTPPSIATTLKEFLNRKTGLNFEKIVIGSNDTCEGELAFCNSPEAEGHDQIGCVVDGTGFNFSTGEYNNEAGHYGGGENTLSTSTVSQISLAQMGGGAMDVECLCSGKIIGMDFLNAVRALRYDPLIAKLEKMTDKKRVMLAFQLAYSETEPDTKEERILEGIAKALVSRASDALSKMLAAAHKAGFKGVFFGEGSLVRKEPAYVEDVNGQIREYLKNPKLHDLLVVAPLPAKAANDTVEVDPDNIAASFVGLCMDAHAQGLQEFKKQIAQ